MVAVSLGVVQRGVVQKGVYKSGDVLKTCCGNGGCTNVSWTEGIFHKWGATYFAGVVKYLTVHCTVCNVHV